MTVFPVQLLLQLVSSLGRNNNDDWTDWEHEGLTHPLTEANHRPHGAAQGAAAAQTPEQQPADVDWQSLPECDVDPCDGRLARGEHWLVDISYSLHTLNSSGATRECKDGGNSVSNLFERPNLEIYLCIPQFLLFLLLLSWAQLSSAYTVMFPAPRMMTGSGTMLMSGASRMEEFSSWSS